MDAQDQQEVAWRLRCLQGHIDGLIRMLEADEPTPSLLLQIKAIHGGVEMVKGKLIRNYLAKCSELAAFSERHREFEQALQALEQVYFSDNRALEFRLEAEAERPKTALG